MIWLKAVYLLNWSESLAVDKFYGLRSYWAFQQDNDIKEDWSVERKDV